MIELNCKVVKKWQPPIHFYINPPFQVYPPFLAKNFVPPPPPSDSIFGRSYSPPLIRGEVPTMINNNFFKQTDGCAMGGPLSVTFSDIFMIKMENDIVIPTKPIFYHSYVDDIIEERKILRIVHSKH